MKRTLTVLGMTILICVVLPGSASAQQAIVLKGGKLLTVSHGTIENGVHTVFNGSMRDREQLAALEHNRLLRTCAARENNADKNCHSEYGQRPLHSPSL